LALQSQGYTERAGTTATRRDYFFQKAALTLKKKNCVHAIAGDRIYCHASTYQEEKERRSLGMSIGIFYVSVIDITLKFTNYHVYRDLAKIKTLKTPCSG
jgi:hypothetical protein